MNAFTHGVLALLLGVIIFLILTVGAATVGHILLDRVFGCDEYVTNDFFYCWIAGIATFAVLVGLYLLGDLLLSVL